MNAWQRWMRWFGSEWSLWLWSARSRGRLWNRPGVARWLPRGRWVGAAVVGFGLLVLFTGGLIAVSSSGGRQTRPMGWAAAGPAERSTLRSVGAPTRVSVPLADLPRSVRGVAPAPALALLPAVDRPARPVLRAWDRPTAVDVPLAELQPRLDPAQILVAGFSTDNVPDREIQRALDRYAAATRDAAIALFLRDHRAAAPHAREATSAVAHAVHREGWFPASRTSRQKLLAELEEHRYTLWKAGDWLSVGTEAGVSRQLAEPGTSRLFDAELFYNDGRSVAQDVDVVIANATRVLALYGSGAFPTVPAAKRDEMIYTCAMTAWTFVGPHQSLPWLQRAAEANTLLPDQRRLVRERLVLALARTKRSVEAREELADWAEAEPGEQDSRIDVVTKLLQEGWQGA